MQRTLAIIKPDAVKNMNIGAIINKLEESNLKIIAMRMTQLSRKDAELFYAVHVERPFFKDLVDFMVSGQVVILALQGDNAVSRYRELMGATDPKAAAPGTIRAEFAESIDANAVHGSDSLENAAKEISFFFQGSELG